MIDEVVGPSKLLPRKMGGQGNSVEHPSLCILEGIPPKD